MEVLKLLNKAKTFDFETLKQGHFVIYLESQDSVRKPTISSLKT